MSYETRVKIQFETKATVLLKTAINKDDTISIEIGYQVNGDKVKYIENAIDILNKAVAIFKSLNLTQIEDCIIYGKEKEEEVNLKVFSKFIVPMHESCQKQIEQAHMQNIAEENLRTKYLPINILYAILGVFVGSIPSLILMIVLDIISVCLFALIPLSAFYGYKLRNVPQRKYTMVIISIISFVIVFLMEIFYLQMIAVSGEFDGSSELFTVSERSRILLLNLLLTFLFTALGIVFAWSIIKRKKKA